MGHGPLKKVKTIEVGNIFPLKTRFSEAFGLTYKDKNGKDQLVVMGCYGIGISRLMGTVVEVHHDENGIIWPASVAPFDVHLVAISNGKPAITEALKVYEALKKNNIEVLWDDREDVSAGEKFADADLIGIPVRLVVSAKTGDKVEWKRRDEEKTELLSLNEVLRKLQ